MSITLDGSSGINTSSSVTTGTGAIYNGLQQSTAQNTTSGTSITFSSIPSWVKRITVMFNGVSTSGTSGFYMQVGSGSLTTTGYVGNMIPVQTIAVSGTGVADSTGFILVQPLNLATDTHNGIVTITNITGNTWVESSSISNNTASRIFIGNGSIALSGALDRVAIITTNGTDTFDAGSVNIIYE